MDNYKVKLRRYEDDLNIGGSGVIVMGMWAALKALMELFLGSEKYIDLNEISDDPGLRVLGAVVIFIMVTAILSFIIMLHLYVGLNAIRASKGKKYRRGYLVMAVIMLILTVLSLVAYKDKLKDIKVIDNTLASLLVDITTIYIYVAMIRSAYMIKKLNSMHQIRE
ncbi:MAG: hypothetical protein IK111_08685 [Lachnospiraceae bacterium]|nr:hypothetical protein [Lachnospiraceae bacterium]